MNIKKPLIGILATPFIKEDQGNKKKPQKNDEIFLKEDILKAINPHANHLVVPYNLSKSSLKNIVKTLDGIIVPGSQLGNFYHTKEFQEHYKTEKKLIKIAKKINKNERTFPLLTICHGYQNLILIENNIIPNKKTDYGNKIFLKADSYNGYKYPVTYTHLGKKFQKLLTYKNKNKNKNKKFTKRSKKMVYNNKLGFSPKYINKTKKISVLSNYRDKTGKQIVSIIKYKNLPFYGFQGHPERVNKELLSPFFNDVKTSFLERKQDLSKNNKRKSRKTRKTKFIKLKMQTKKCINLGLSKNKNKSCNFYKLIKKS